MNDQNLALKNLVRSVKRTLKTQHGIEVPHAALRASLLLAQGENPHSFGKKAPPAAAPSMNAGIAELVRQAPEFFHPGYDFDGRKLEWLQRAGLVPFADPARVDDARSLYLVADDVGCLERLSLDAEGRLCLPEDFDFSKVALVRQFARVPSVKRYGLPEYLSNVAKFYREHFGLKVDLQASMHYVDSEDDSGDACRIGIRVAEEVWVHLCLAALKANSGVRDELAEWVGQHYQRNFSAESAIKKADWLERFLETLNVENEDCFFEFVYPDEEGDHVSASLNLETGFVTLNGEVPDDIGHYLVRVRLWVGGEDVGEGVDYQLHCVEGQWQLFSHEVKYAQQRAGYLPRGPARP